MDMCFKWDYFDNGIAYHAISKTHQTILKNISDTCYH